MKLMATPSSSRRLQHYVATLLLLAPCAVIDAQWNRLWEYMPSNSLLASQQAQPLKRAAHSLIVFQDSMYVFGGIGDTNSEEDHEFDDTWKYDILGDHWSNVIGDREGSPTGRGGRRISPQHRFHQSTALHSNATVDEMVIFGGLSITPNITTNSKGVQSADMVITQYNDVWRLSLGPDGTEVWQADAPVSSSSSSVAAGSSAGSLGPSAGSSPTKALSVASGKEPKPRSEAGAVAHDGQLYVYGGISYDDTKDSTPVDYGDLWRYNLSDCTWTQIVPDDGVVPPGRFSHSFSKFTTEAGETFLVVFSGRHLELPSWSLLGDTWLFSLTTQRWRLMPSTPALQRAYTTVVTTGGAVPKMWFFGGYFRPRQSSSGYVYDDVVSGLFTPTDASNTSMQLQFYHAVINPEDAVPPLRYNHRAVLWRDTMIIHGGSYQSQRGDVWRFNLTTAELRKDSATAMPVNLETLVYVLAGFVFAIVFLLVALIIRWRRIDRRNMEIARMRGVAAMRGVAKERLDQMEITKYKKPIPADGTPSAPRLPNATGDDFDHNNEDICPICLIEFEEDEDVRNLPCKHLFHVPCIDEWLSRNTTCPMCKNNLDLDAVDIAIAPDSPTGDRPAFPHQHVTFPPPPYSGAPASTPAIAEARGGAIVTPVVAGSGSP